MATAVQVLANQRNALASTGPTTPEGRNISSRNATTHGLTAAFRVLPHESQSEFDELLARYRSEYQPRGEHQHFLVDLMAQSRWKLNRIDRLEAAAFEEILTDPGSSADPDARILSTLGRSGNVLERLARYRSAAERAYFRAYRQMIELHARNIRNTAGEAQIWLRTQLGSPAISARRPARQNEPKSARTNPALRL